MKKTNFTRTNLLQIFTGIFVACLLISNVLAAKTFTLGPVILPTAVIIFPIVYIVNDVLAEIYGFKKTRQIIYLGFALNLLAVIAYTIAIRLPEPVFAKEGAAAFATTLGVTGRVLTASVIAYLVGSLLNASVMEKMKKKLHKHLMLRCVTSTLVGEGLDAIIFIFIAFGGTMPTDELVIMIVSQAAFKTVFELIAFPATRVTIRAVNNMGE